MNNFLFLCFSYYSRKPPKLDEEKLKIEKECKKRSTSHQIMTLNPTKAKIPEIFESFSENPLKLFENFVIESETEKFMSLGTLNSMVLDLQ